MFPEKYSTFQFICTTFCSLRMSLISCYLQKHARSEKLLNEGRLKLMLNDKGKVEGEMDYEERAPRRASRQVLFFIVEHAEW